MLTLSANTLWVEDFQLRRGEVTQVTLYLVPPPPPYLPVGIVQGQLSRAGGERRGRVTVSCCPAKFNFCGKRES